MRGTSVAEFYFVSFKRLSLVVWRSEDATQAGPLSVCNTGVFHPASDSEVPCPIQHLCDDAPAHPDAQIFLERDPGRWNLGIIQTVY